MDVLDHMRASLRVLITSETYMQEKYIKGGVVNINLRLRYLAIYWWNLSHESVCSCVTDNKIIQSVETPYLGRVVKVT